MNLTGRKISSGNAEGEALVTSMGISFYGGVDPETGRVVEKGHELEGQSIAGRVLVFPTGKGSTVGSYTLYRLKKAGLAPVAIVNAAPANAASRQRPRRSISGSADAARQALKQAQVAARNTPTNKLKPTMPVLIATAR